MSLVSTVEDVLAWIDGGPLLADLLTVADAIAKAVSQKTALSAEQAAVVAGDAAADAAEHSKFGVK